MFFYDIININWRAKIRLSISNYRPPAGFGKNDYVQYKYHAITANTVIENQRKLDSLA